MIAHTYRKLREDAKDARRTGLLLSGPKRAFLLRQAKALEVNAANVLICIETP